MPDPFACAKMASGKVIWLGEKASWIVSGIGKANLENRLCGADRQILHEEKHIVCFNACIYTQKKCGVLVHRTG